MAVVLLVAGTTCCCGCCCCCCCASCGGASFSGRTNASPPLLFNKSVAMAAASAVNEDEGGGSTTLVEDDCRWSFVMLEAGQEDGVAHAAAAAEAGTAAPPPALLADGATGTFSPYSRMPSATCCRSCDVKDLITPSCRVIFQRKRLMANIKVMSNKYYMHIMYMQGYIQEALDCTCDSVRNTASFCMARDAFSHLFRACSPDMLVQSR